MRKDTHEYLGVWIVATPDRSVGRLGEVSRLVLDGLMMVRAMEVVSSRQDDVVANTTITCQCHAHEAGETGNKGSENLDTHCSLLRSVSWR